MKANNQTDYLEMVYDFLEPNYCRVRNGVLKFGRLRSMYSGDEAQTIIPLSRIDLYFYTPEKPHPSGKAPLAEAAKITFILTSGKEIDVKFGICASQDEVDGILSVLEESVGHS